MSSKSDLSVRFCAPSGQVINSCLLIVVVTIACHNTSFAEPISRQLGKEYATLARSPLQHKRSLSQAKLGQILKSLLDDLDRVSKVSEEIFDTDVRERMWMAVDKSFINPKKGYVLPGEFGMFTNRDNADVKEALRKFIQLASEWAMRNQVKSREARLAAFQDPNVASRNGSHYDDFFGDTK